MKKNMFLIVLLYIVEAKKGCKKKSLNILSLAAYLLKMSFRRLFHVYTCGHFVVVVLVKQQKIHF